MRRFWIECIWLTSAVVLVVLHTTLYVDIFEQLLHPILLLAVLFGVYGFHTRSVYFAFVCGYMLELFSTLPFGVITVSYISSVAVLYLFQKRIFKNTATHAFVINAIIATGVYHAVFLLCIILSRAVGVVQVSSFSWMQYATTALWQTAIHILILAVIFIVDSLLQKRIVVHKHT